MPFDALLAYLRPRCAGMLADLEAIVTHESPSRDLAALDALGATLAARFEALGAHVQRVGNPQGADHWRARWEVTGDGSDARPALVLCHFDTVWPLGTIARRPFRIEGGNAYGPGIVDMKASLVLVVYALRALRELGMRPPRPIVVLLTSDEEIGSAGSRRLIESEAQRSDYVLVMEAPLPRGRLKTARKGVGHFTVAIEGRASHAGVEPEKGVSAIQELAHQILHIHNLADPAAGTTLNVGVVEGGSVSNVVPARATAHVDVRVRTLDEARRIEGAMAALRPVLPGARLVVTGDFDRPPMERTPAVAALFERARDLAHALGIELTEGSTGGASDGNFTAALGVPTLDGLGALGGGAHAEDEHIEIDSLPERAALLAALLLGL